MVSITLRMLHKPSIPNLPEIYKTLGINYDDKVLPSIANEVMKAVVAQFNAEELITNRDLVSKLISEGITARSKDFHILLDDISVTHLTFGKEFTQAVESKVVGSSPPALRKMLHNFKIFIYNCIIIIIIIIIITLKQPSKKPRGPNLSS